MTEPQTTTVTSADGTVLAVDQWGDGPPVILVHGAFTDRSHHTLSRVAATLAPWFTVFNYDRRGRGESDNVAPYDVDREVDDAAALISAAGGTAMVFGGSSGAALALRVAAREPGVTRLALWEPPYHVDDGAPHLPDDFAAQLDSLVMADRRGDAVALFLTVAAEVPDEAVAAMRADPTWTDLEGIAHTLSYEAAVMGPGNRLPAQLLSTVTQPTLVLTGEKSPLWMVNAGTAVTDALPHAVRRILSGQSHGVAPEALAPELLEFFATG